MQYDEKYSLFIIHYSLFCGLCAEVGPPDDLAYE